MNSDKLGVLFLKTTLLTLGILFSMLTITLISIGSFFSYQFSIFAQESGLGPKQVVTLLRTARRQTPVAEGTKKNFLILGVDSLPGRGDVPPLTDTILLLSLDLETAQTTALSLPRDLWSEPYKTKINALLAYGYERDANSPTTFPEEVFQEMAGLPIHHSIILSLEQVENLIDVLGGIEVDVPEGFVDEEFPRTGVDVTIERDPNILYERVEFVSGTQTMTGERALKYIRSRHSQDDQGNDRARAQRQQQVISALMRKALSRQVLTQPKLLGKLYRFYEENFAVFLSVEELLTTANAMRHSVGSFKLKTTSLGVFPEDINGTLEHPSVDEYDGQWVYALRDELLFKEEVKTKLELNEDTTL